MVRAREAQTVEQRAAVRGADTAARAEARAALMDEERRTVRGADTAARAAVRAAQTDEERAAVRGADTAARAEARAALTDEERAAVRAADTAARGQVRVASRSEGPPELSVEDVDMLKLQPHWGKDPHAALLAHAASSGLSGFQALDSLTPAMAADPAAPAATSTYEDIVRQLQAQAIGPPDFAKIVEAFQSSCGQRAPLPACGSCGVRCKQKTTSHVVSNLVEFQLDKEQREAYTAAHPIKQQAASVYALGSGAEQQLFWLHPELVGTRTGVDTVELCKSCQTGLDRIRKGRANREKPPPRSLLAGVDFGAPARLGLEPLTHVERTLLGLSRTYETVFKLTQGPYQHHRFTGQAITFRHPGE